jgi:virulence factor Mce-like protein
VRRAAIVVFVLALAAAGVVASAGAGGKDGTVKYKIAFDNAFGVVKGADFKVGGVAVGSIEDLDVSRKDARALITVTVKDKGFGSLRSDAKCSIQPQSLIGEYFVDCQPGQTGRVLPVGSTIPVQQTESPIPADLVANVMRRPYRERFSIILGELGAGLAARGDDLNATIRRAIPALTETDRVLKILGDNRRTLQSLTRDSASVMRVLGRRRKDVGRFIVSARNTSRATAERRQALQATFQKFPGFLDQLEPTMTDLGTASGRLAPTFADLRSAAPSLTNLLRTLNPFSRALQPALTSLGTAGVTGRKAATEAESLVSLLGRLGKNSPEMAKNAAIVFGDLDDRSRAIAPDPDSPEGKGYTGLEALLTYVFDQSQSLNIFDQRGYILKLDALINECSDYTTAQEAKEDPERFKRCTQQLGPNMPGITSADPTASSTPAATTTKRKPSKRSKTKPGKNAPSQPGENNSTPSTPDDVKKKLPKLPDVQVPKLPGLPNLPDLIKQLPDVQVPTTGSTNQAPSASDLLDFLLAP